MEAVVAEPTAGNDYWQGSGFGSDGAAEGSFGSEAFTRTTWFQISDSAVLLERGGAVTATSLQEMWRVRSSWSDTCF